MARVGMLGRVHRWTVVGLFTLVVAGLAGGTAAVGLRATGDEASLASGEAGQSGKAKGNKPATAEADPADENEVHGGTVERFHGDTDNACPLPEGVTLEGNWTHGDYVSAWAATDDAEAHKAAAKGPCGKPQKAVDNKARAAERRAAKPSKPAKPAKPERGGRPDSDD